MTSLCVSVSHSVTEDYQDQTVISLKESTLTLFEQYTVFVAARVE
jgi:hypothetical protein